MGTRSLTSVFDGDVELCTMYRQFDGYVTGHGVELLEWLTPIKIVNGLGQDASNVANGAGCLAAQMVAHFKKNPGGFYLYAPGARDVWEEFRYEVHVTAPEKAHDVGTIQVKIYAVRDAELLFMGLPAVALDWAKTQ